MVDEAFFPRFDQAPELALAPGVRARVVSGRRVMLSLVELEAGAVVPPHSHPNEQAGLVLEGEVEMEVGGRRQRLHPGDTYLVPPGVEHAVVAVPRPSRLLDVFSPPREDYRRG